MFRLIISEKPSVAQSIAYCIGANERIADGKFSYYQGNGYIVANASDTCLVSECPKITVGKAGRLKHFPLFPRSSNCFRSTVTAVRLSCLKSLSAVMM